jgi:hypothetical protein
VNFNYFISETVFAFILDAVDFVARHGWRFLVDYNFCPATGQWRHRAGRGKPAQSLLDITYRAGKMEYRSRHTTEPEWTLASYLEDAERLLALLPAQPAADATPPRSPDFEVLRWFPLPGDADRSPDGSRKPIGVGLTHRVA